VILIVASDEDVHARRVAQEIEHIGAPAAIFDWRTAANTSVASLRYGTDRARRSVRLLDDHRAFDLREVDAVWTRRVGPATVPPSILGVDQRSFVAAEWWDLLYGLLDGPHAVSPLDAQRSATKPAQLARAPRAGLTIPDTLITSDPLEAGGFIDEHGGRVVHKTMNSPRDRLLATLRWEERHRSDLARLPLVPTIFQELIEGPRDLRVTVIGTTCYAASIEGGASAKHVDSRLDVDVPIIPFELPPALASALIDLMGLLGLTFATIDLKQAWDGTFYFLELNPQGQFLYIEILTGLPITAGMARHLAGLESRSA
jgi:hypothetical protein